MIWHRSLGSLCALGLFVPGCAFALRGQAVPAPLPDAPSSALPQNGSHTLGKGNIAVVNGRPYVRPTRRAQLHDYVRDTYGWPALARTTVRALYAEGREKPAGWGTDAAGFGQRFGSSAAVTVINGNVRLAGEIAFREDLRYYPCHGCGPRRKIENALLAEITARHDSNGHRFFTLTPTISDFSGPIITHTIWYPGSSSGPYQGVIAARTVFATRLGAHLFQEFVLERRHRDAPAD